MSKKGKRKKGNTTGSLERRSRPSLPGVSGATAPPSRASVPTAPPVATAGASPTLTSTAPAPATLAMGATGAMGGRSPNHPAAHTDVLVAKTTETSAAAELAPLPSSPPVASEIPPRSDKQEESGPRIVAFAPKDDAKPEGAKKPEKKAETAKAEKTEKAASRKSERPPAKSERPAAKASQPPPAKSSPPAAAAKAERAERKDGESMPPAVELEHESFFEAGEKADKEHRAVARGVLPVDHEHEVDLAVKHKMSPAVRERRARFTKYVKWAVGASAIVCLAALVRVTVARGQNGGESFAGGSQAAEISAPMPIQTVTPAPDPTLNQASPPPPAPAPAPAVDPTAAPTAGAVPATTATPDPASTAAAPGAAPAAAGAAPATEPDPAAAKVEKLAAKKALERGDMKGAIEAGERSVALDPTDGDAWLLLGAAYQEKGKGVDARRAFTACIKQGKRGAIGECAAMLR